MDHPIGNVVAVDLYERDAVVRRNGHAPPPADRTRGEVTEFSEESRRRLAFVANNTAVEFRTLITLTYPRNYPHDGRTVKRHLRAFLQSWRRWTVGASYLWFLEFQRRGAPHVHVLTDYPLPSRRTDKKNVQRWVSQRWYDICNSGDPKHLVAGTRIERLRNRDNPGAYAVKYASKMEQKHVPKDYRNVGRFWGHTQDVKPEPIFHVPCTEEDIREALHDAPHAPPAHRPVYRVLYNQAARIAETFTTGFDKDAE
jgi:hypothetical protein